MNQRGSATLMVLSVLLALSAAFAGAAGLIGAGARALRMGRERQEARVRLRVEAKTVMAALLADPTPFADSPRDPAWTLLATPRTDGTTLQLEDVSSRLGLNWVRKEVLADSGALLPGHSAQDVQQHREDAGLRVNLGTGYGDYIEDDALQTLFTAYGWFNINISDEFVLRAVYRARGHDPVSAERFRAVIQQARTAKRVIGPSDLEDFLGPEQYAVVFPVVNAEPVLNVHFVSERALRVLFKHYDLPEAGVRDVLDARRSAEVTPSVLEHLLAGGGSSASPLAPYLGLRTWFWRITAATADRRLEWIVARMPRLDGAPEFRIVEERFAP